MKQEALERIFEIQRAKDAGDAHGERMLSRARLALHEQLYKTENGFDQEMQEGL